ncbi:MAG: protein phosphatase CheZ [Pusillimonas sp.]|nr:protein phosphatase CheZ [Pusillimonas sp.]
MSTENNGIKSGADGHPPELIQQVANVTRMLRESMRELGLDRAITEAADAIPDARDRLDYVANKTEQAATRVLNIAEQMQPAQEEMQKRAQALDQRWQAWFDQPAELPEARELVNDTRALLQDIPERTQVAQQQILEIIMAQDFQDLTGQVISRMLGVINSIETELIQVLISHLPKEEQAAKRKEIDQLLNGPQIKPAEKPDVVSNQDQVDDLLSSLGF